MEQAKIKAIESGYSEGNAELFSPFQLLDDDNFWKAIGKNQGWTMTIQCPVCDRYAHQDHAPDFNIAGWLYQKHRWVDHKAEGGTTDSFFKSLLK